MMLIMNLKSVMRKLLPPIVLDVYRQSRSAYRTGLMWTGTVYSHYRDVPSEGKAFESNEWINSRAELTKTFHERLASEPIPVSTGFRYSSLALLGSVILQNQKRLRILDFGGAMGFAYPIVLKSLGDPSAIEYIVVDNQASCKKGTTIFEGDHRIRFLSSLDKNIGKIDIIFVSGVLQYIEEYGGVLQHLTTFKPTYFLFTCLSAGGIQTFASGQRNLKGSVFPSWFLNAKDLIRQMAECGYEVMFRVSNELEDQIDMSNFRDEFRLSHMSNFLFCKKRSRMMES